MALAVNGVYCYALLRIRLKKFRFAAFPNSRRHVEFQSTRAGNSGIDGFVNAFKLVSLANSSFI